MRTHDSHIVNQDSLLWGPESTGQAKGQIQTEQGTTPNQTKAGDPEGSKNPKVNDNESRTVILRESRTMISNVRGQGNLLPRGEVTDARERERERESRQALSRRRGDLMKKPLQQIQQTVEGQEQEGTNTTPILYRWCQGVREEQMSRHQGVPWIIGTRTVSSDTKNK